MKMLWRLSREAKRYKGLYIVAILSTLGLIAVNLAAPKVLAAMTGTGGTSTRARRVWFWFADSPRAPCATNFAYTSVCSCSSISNGLERRQVPNLVRSGRKQP